MRPVQSWVRSSLLVLFQPLGSRRHSTTRMPERVSCRTIVAPGSERVLRVGSTISCPSRPLNTSNTFGRIIMEMAGCYNLFVLLHANAYFDLLFARKRATCNEHHLCQMPGGDYGLCCIFAYIRIIIRRAFCIRCCSELALALRGMMLLTLKFGQCTFGAYCWLLESLPVPVSCN